MVWRLKDRELEKKLNELSKGEFSKNLHQYDDEHFASFCGEIISLTEDCGYEFDESAGKGVYRQSQFLFFFNNDAIEEVPEYNPNGWNEFPKVRPPYDVMMRIEMKNGLKFGAYFRHFEDGDRWCNPKHLLMSEAFSGLVTRFRPWED